MERKISRSGLQREGSTSSLPSNPIAQQTQPQNLKVKLEQFKKFRQQEEEDLAKAQRIIDLYDNAFDAPDVEGAEQRKTSCKKKILVWDAEIQKITQQLQDMGVDLDEEDDGSSEDDTPIEKMTTPVVVNEASMDVVAAKLDSLGTTDSIHLWNISPLEPPTPLDASKHRHSLRFMHLHLSPSVQIGIDLPVLVTLAITDCGLIDSDFSEGAWLGDLSPLVNVRRLYFGQNHLRVIPAPIFKLQSLLVLSLPNNKIVEISPDIQLLQSLRYLALDSNQLERLDPAILTLPRLRGFSASHNRLATEPMEVKQLLNVVHVMNFAGNPFLTNTGAPSTASVVGLDPLRKSRHLTLTPVMVRSNRKSSSLLLPKRDSPSTPTVEPSDAGNAADGGAPATVPSEGLPVPFRTLRRSSSAGASLTLPIRPAVDTESKS
eukprot:Opistho-2@51907